MSFLLAFFGILTIFFGISGFIVYPIIAFESDAPAVNFIPIGLLVISSLFLAYDFMESDVITYNLDENNGILTVNAQDSEKKINKIQINHITTKKEWKFF